MCESQNLTVVRLKRFAEGPVKLGMLSPGNYRMLKKEEIIALRTAALKGRNAAENKMKERRNEKWR